MNFNITSGSLKKIHSENQFHDSSKLQELSEPSGIESSFNIEPGTLIEIKSALTRIYQSGSSDWNSSNKQWQSLDAQASVELHRLLANLPMEIAMFKGFWRYLSVYCCDVVSKRYGYKNLEEEFDPKHFGEQIYESILPRLWFRAVFSKDIKSDDVYWLTKKGSSDFWSSFVLRRVYAQSKTLIRSMLKYFYVGDNITFKRDGLPLTTQEAFRLIGPAVRRQHSLSPFELMSEEDCFNTLELLASELKIQRLLSEDGN